MGNDERTVKAPIRNYYGGHRVRSSGGKYLMEVKDWCGWPEESREFDEDQSVAISKEFFDAFCKEFGE